MIGFVTWPPFSQYSYKGGQVTKPTILVKICYKLLYVIQGVENSFGKVIYWPQLISEVLVAHACFLIGLALFYTQGDFV